MKDVEGVKAPSGQPQEDVVPAGEHPQPWQRAIA